MVRLLFFRAFWSDSLFAIALVALSAGFLVPDAMERNYFLALGGMNLIVALIIRSTLPLLIVFRKSTEGNIDALLVDDFMREAVLYARPVWFENPRDTLVRGDLIRPTPYSLFFVLISLLVLTVWSFNAHGLFTAAVIACLALFGSMCLLDASIGNPAGPAIGFLVAAAYVGPVPTRLTSLSQFVHDTVLFVAVFVGYWALGSVVHKLRTMDWSPFNTTVGGRFDRAWLCMEMWMPLCFITRFVHGGPAMIRQVKGGDAWFKAVCVLLKRSRYAVVDISYIDESVETPRELRRCYKKSIKILLTCREDKVNSALTCVRKLLPNACILPNNFFNNEKFSKIGTAGVNIVQIIVYRDEKGGSAHFACQARVFFGEVTLDEWFQAIVASRHHAKEGAN